MNSPLISVFIPCYNQAQYLARALDSVLAQDYPNLEIILGDDASTDNTAETVKKYLSNPRIRYCPSSKNIGRVANYHRGLYELAKGDWYINLDGDDYYTNTKYLSLAIHHALKNSKCILVFGRQKYEDPNLEVIYTNPSPEVPEFFDGKYLLANPQKEGIPHMSALYKREVALKAHLFENDILYADAEAMLRLLPFGQVGFINEFAGIWVQHGKNASYTPGVEKRVANLKMTLAPYEFFKSHQLVEPTLLETWKTRMLRYQLLDTSLFFLDHGDRKSFFEYFRHFATLLSPADRFSVFASWRFWLRFLFPNAAWLIKRIKGLVKA